MYGKLEHTHLNSHNHAQKYPPTTPIANLDARSSFMAEPQNSTPDSTAKTVFKTPAKVIKFATGHPRLMKRYAVPLALATLSTPVISALPLGSLGPVLAFVAVACGRFKMQQEIVSSGHAILKASGMVGLEGQALSLLGLVGLEAAGMFFRIATCIVLVDWDADHV